MHAPAAALLALLALAVPAGGAAAGGEILFVGAYSHDATGPSRVLVIRADGSGSRLVAAGAASPRWSPDGASIVLTSLTATANGGLAATGLDVLAANGGAPRQITEGSDRAQAWSPDGRWIAFVRSGDREAGLYVVHPDGSGSRLLSRAVAPASAASWAPDSRRLLVVTRHQHLATLDLRGRVHAVPDAACTNDGSFSPSGRWIAMSRCAGSRSHTGIAIERADGRHFRWLVQPRSRYGAFGVIWSPDGAKLAYTLSREVKPSYLDHTEIRLISVGGKRLGNLDSTAQDHDEYPAWSPDGRQIVFDRDAALEPVGEDDRLFVGDVATGRVRQLYAGTDRGEQSWRPRRR